MEHYMYLLGVHRDQAVLLAAGAEGVHLGADDLDPARVRSIAPDGFRIGVSVGTEDEAKQALSADVDYWSLGSIFHTDTKRDAGAPIGTEGFRRKRTPRYRSVAFDTLFENVSGGFVCISSVFEALSNDIALGSV